MQRHADRQLKEALGRQPGCLDLERLDALNRGAADPWRAQAEEHLAWCPRCSTELELLRSFEAGPGSPGEAAAADAIARRLAQRFGNHPRPALLARLAGAFQPARIRAWSAAAACLAVAMTAGVYMRDRGAPALPADIAVDTLRSAQVTLLGPAGAVTDKPAAFRWSAVAGAAKYRVRVAEVDRTELWSVEAVETELAIPQSIQARMVPRKTLQWQVTALAGDGTTLAVSTRERFVLTPGGLAQ